MKNYNVRRIALPKQAQSGFAIILVMGILLVAAAVTATLLARQENETVWAPIENTNDQIDAVSKAIAAYERKNHRLPLPAARTTDGGMVLHTEATSLVESDYSLPSAVDKTLDAGATAYAGPGGIAYVSNDPTDVNNVVLIGALPTETLGLPQTAAEDSYGRLLTYAVTLASTNPFTYEASEGAITLQNNDGAEVANKLSYIVIAHGKEGAGAWNAKNRAQGRDCSGNMLKDLESGGGAGGVSDQANCDENDATFIVHDVTLVAGEGYFDDQLLRGRKDKVAQTISRPCAAETVSWGKDGMCSGVIPEPGIMHYASNLEPREVVVTHDGAAAVNCPKGGCSTDPDKTEIGMAEVVVDGGVTGSVTVTCNDGGLVFSNASCSSEDVKSGCTLSDGRFLEEGQCGPACVATKGQNCPAVENHNLLCTDGEAVPFNKPCSENAAASCTTPWGQTVAVNDSVQAYTRAGEDSKDCAITPVTHTCTASTKNGATAFVPAMESWATAASDCAASTECTTPWGSKLADGATVTAYEQDVIACGGAKGCKSQTLTCNNGTITGADTSKYKYASCSMQSCGCTTPWGATVADGATVTSYGACDSGSKGGPSCSSTTHTCSSTAFSPAISGSQSCNCAAEEPCTGKGCEDESGGGLGTIEADAGQSCSQEGQCVDCCVPSKGVECPAHITQCRCTGGNRVSDNSCNGGGGGATM